LALGYDALEFGVFKRMILGAYGQMFLGRIHGRTFGHRPGCKDSIDRQSKVIMQMAGVVLLDDKEAPTPAPPRPTHRFRRFGELSLPAIVFE
jgi:hypothetical protein